MDGPPLVYADFANRVGALVASRRGAIPDWTISEANALGSKNRTAGDGMKLNSVLLKSTVVAALGGLLFGFDTAVISGTTSALTQVYGLSSKSLGITVSIAIWGTVVGAMLAGFPGERYRTARQLANHGALLFSLRAGLRAGLELVVSACLSLHRRAGHWWLVCAGSDVHRRNCPREMAGTISWACFSSM